MVAELAQGEQAREKLASLLQLDDARLLPQPLLPALPVDPQRLARIGDMPWPLLVARRRGSGATCASWIWSWKPCAWSSWAPGSQVACPACAYSAPAAQTATPCC